MSTSPSLTSRAVPLMNYLAKQRENQKFGRSLEISITFILITFFVIFAVRPAVTTVTGLIGQIKAKELQSQKMRQKINDIIQAQDAFSAIQEKYTVIQSVLPDTPRYNQSVTQLQVISQNSGIPFDPVNINLKDAATPEQNSPLKNYSINFSGRINYASVANLINQIRQNRRLFQIDSISVAQAKDKDIIITDGSVDLHFQARAFYWNNEQP